MPAEQMAGPASPKDKYESVTVAVADAYLSQFSAVVQRCKKVGLKIESQLPQLGVITGFIPSNKIAALMDVEGVAHVERSWIYTTMPVDESKH